MVAVVHTDPIEMPPLRLVPSGPELPSHHDLATTTAFADGLMFSYRTRRWLAAAMAAAMIWLVITTTSTLVSLAVGVGEPTLPGNGGPVTHTIQPGDTVWSVARQYQPGGDVRPFVDDIVGLNGGTNLVVGQELVLAP